MGLPKTTKRGFAKIIEQSHEDVKIISGDNYYYNDNKFHSEHILNKYYEKINLMLQNYKYVVIDDINYVIKDYRDNLFKNIKLSKEDRVIGLWIDVPLQIAIDSDLALPKAQQTPASNLRDFNKIKKFPTKLERFDDIIDLTLNDEDYFNKDLRGAPNMVILKASEAIKQLQNI